MTNTPRFTVSRIEWEHERSKIIGSNKTVRTVIKQADVTCNSCQHSWTAGRVGGGKFLPILGGILLECPSCGEQGKVAGKDLK